MKIIKSKFIWILGLTISTNVIAENRDDYGICMKNANNQSKTMKDCQLDEVKQQDKRVNQNFKKLLSKSAKDQRELLQNNQNHWLIQRKKMCGIKTKELEDLPIAQIHCVINVTTARAEALEVQLRNKNLR